MVPTTKELATVPDERIINRIFVIRNKKVMLDRDLAALYDVETRALTQAVRRNHERFPDDFMFRLTWDEAKALRSQTVILDNTGGEASRSQTGTSRRGTNVKYQPYVFTEQGVAMLSSVLRSKRAIQVNIQIMRMFTKLREMLETHRDLREKIEAMERKYDQRFKIVFDAIKQLLTEEVKPKNVIGFRSSAT